MILLSPSVVRNLSIILVALFTAGGLLCLYASVMGSRWFFRSPNVRWLSDLMPLWCARIIYGIIGIAILAMALTMLRQL